MWDSIIIIPFTNVLLYIYQLVGNFGLAIILFTILIRLITYPLTAQQLKGTKALQELQGNKKYIEIQKKYKNDKEKLAQEQMKLYKEYGINPFASCLPTLIQFPIIIGLYQSVIRSLASTPLKMIGLTRLIYPSLSSILELIPLKSQFLWMNLGQPERLNLSFIPFGIPVLAVIVTLTSFLQAKLIQPPSASGQNDQTAAMSNMMSLYMPLLMGYMAYTLSSGLALYFLTSNIIAIVQYAALGKLDWKNLLPSRQ